MTDLIVGVTAVLAISGAGAALIAANRRVVFVGLLTVVLLFQNIVVMVLLRTGLIAGDGAQVLLGAKEALLAAGLCTLAVLAVPRIVGSGRLHRSWLAGFAIAWIVLVAVHAVASGPPWLPRLAGARSVAILPALFLLGYWLSLSRVEAGKVLRLLFVVAASLAVFGLLEAYVLPQTFWLSIGHEEYYQVKIGRPIQNALYGNMRFWVDGQPVRRVASLTGDPLISSYPMAFAIVLLAARYLVQGRFRYVHLFLGALVAVATLLTLSRGAVLSIFIAIGLLVLAGRSRTVFVLLTGATLIGLVVTAAALGDVILSFMTGAGHIEELLEGLRRGTERVLGYGLGTAGSTATGVARASGAREVILGGGDSYMGSLATQMGLPAMLVFYGFLIAVAGNLARRFTRALRAGVAGSWWYGATAAMMAGLIVTSALNESGFGFIASGITLITAGALSSPRLRIAPVGVGADGVIERGAMEAAASAS